MKIRKRGLAVLLAVLLATMVVPAAAASDTSKASAETEVQPTPFLGGFIKETRVTYPLRIGQWQAQDEHLYDEQYLGASIRYRHDGEKSRWIDLYFYPAGVLPGARLIQEADGTLEGIRLSAGKPGGWSEVDVAPVDAISFTVGHGKSRHRIAARSASLRMVGDGKTYSSAMVMLARDLYYIKGRYSAEARTQSRRQVQAQLEKFMEEVVRVAAVRSTGECWMPPPMISRLPPLTLDAPGRLAMVSEGGTVSAVAYEDRVEALDAASPQAIVMQAAAMGMTGRAIEGCVAPEDMNPSVPEGMRELRMEFRAKPAGRGSPPLPLKPARTGVT